MQYLPPPSSLTPGALVDSYSRDSGGMRQDKSTNQQLTAPRKRSTPRSSQFRQSGWAGSRRRGRSVRWAGNSQKSIRMDKLFVFFLVIAPIAMFFSGFLIARQLRPLENALLISKLFVKRKLLLSLITGFFISAFFTFLYSATSEYSLSKIAAFLVLFVLVSGSYYFGMKLGWGDSLSRDQIDTPPSQNQADALLDNVAVENNFSSLRITINTKKRWILFGLSLFPLIMGGLCALPILGLIIISLLQNYLPESMNIVIWVIVGVLVSYILYARFQDTLEYLFDKEVIEIDNLSVKIESSGSGFKNTKVYSADNIKKLTLMFSLGGTTGTMRRSPFMNSNMPAFMMWHNRGLKRYRSFGRGVDLADAQRILETIYSKFPQYKG